MTSQRARDAAARLRAKFEDVPGQLELPWDDPQHDALGDFAPEKFCESHANGALATHRVEFFTAAPFYVCRPCADEAASLDIRVVPLDGTEA